jgi:pyruvate formate lyase activating enzyme
VTEVAEKATIFDINRYRIEDGPGIRTIIFFKGCPLRCQWCSNPFGLSPEPQLAYNQKKCVLCRTCIEVCPQNAISLQEDLLVTDWGKCIACGTCTRVCLQGARKVVGERYTPLEILQIIRKDAKFYRRDGGGVTLSGGEVMMQADLAKQVLALCRRELIDTAIETSAHAQWDRLSEILPLCDLVFADVKQIDTLAHQKLTGVPNELILGNIQRMAEYVNKNGQPRLILRLPVIPGLNNDERTMIRTADFIAQLPGKIEVNMIPYHRLGSDKYDMVGLSYRLKDLETMKTQDEALFRYCETISVRAQNSSCTVGGGEIATRYSVTSLRG